MSRFPDVPESHPFWADVELLAEKGISTGYSNGTFKPAQTLTRGEMAAFLARTLRMLNLDEMLTRYGVAQASNPEA